MKEHKNWGKIAGLVLHILIGGLLIFTGSQKVLGSVPPEALVKFGLGEQVRLIGVGAVLTALVLLIPRTSSLGVLLISSFWGGAICIHMAHGEPYLFQAVILVLSWVGAYLRSPATLSSFSVPLGMTWRPTNGKEYGRKMASGALTYMVSGNGATDAGRTGAPAQYTERLRGDR
jgi:hypothetical protein